MQINEQQFLEFYDKFVTKIYRYVYFRVGSEQVAQDLTSEAFLKTWQYIKDGKEIGNLSAMTYQVCRNLIADYFRNVADKLPISLDNVADSDLAVADSDLITKAEAGLSLDAIKSRLRLIKEEYQELIIWYYIDDFEIYEISQILGKSTGSVRTALSRAVKALKGAIESD